MTWDFVNRFRDELGVKTFQFLFYFYTYSQKPNREQMQMAVKLKRLCFYCVITRWSNVRNMT